MKRIANGKFAGAALAACLLVIGCLGLTACSSSGSSATGSTSSSAVNVTDMAGRAVALSAPATKVVTVTAGDCEILYAIGAGDTLVGRGEYCDYPAEVSNVATVQSGADLNVEQIVALAPDVVIIDMMDQTDDQIAALENAGMKVVVTNASDIDGVYQAIELIGAVTGKDSNAAQTVSQMKETFSKIEKETTLDGTKTVYFEVSPLAYGLYTAGSGTFMDEIAQMVGLKNAFADVSGWSQISEEQVLQRNPDYIVAVGMSYSDYDPVADIDTRAGWSGLTAVKDGHVFELSSDEITRPGPRLQNAAEDLYSLVTTGTAAKVM